MKGAKSLLSLCAHEVSLVHYEYLCCNSVVFWSDNLRMPKIFCSELKIKKLMISTLAHSHFSSAWSIEFKYRFYGDNNRKVMRLNLAISGVSRLELHKIE